MESDFWTLTGIVALAGFVGSRLWEIWRDYVRSRISSESYVRGLYAEIDFNVTDLTDFNLKRASAPDVRRALDQAYKEGRDLIPHITDARHTVIYSDSLGQISALPNDLIRDVVEFYGDLEKIREIIVGLAKPSFSTISDQGKINVIMNLFEKSQRTEDLGRSLLNRIEVHDKFRRLKLTRKERSKDDVSLKERLDALSSHLDRIRHR